jgi:hypothetical protein
MSASRLGIDAASATDRDMTKMQDNSARGVALNRACAIAG